MSRTSSIYDGQPALVKVIVGASLKEFLGVLVYDFGMLLGRFFVLVHLFQHLIRFNGTRGNGWEWLGVGINVAVATKETHGAHLLGHGTWLHWPLEGRRRP